MSYLGIFSIDDLLTFYAQTTKFDTGVATDGDAPPSYRVYEAETATPLLTGDMALLDDANTVGLYSEQITLSAANGFEAGKCYAIRKAVAVNSVSGAAVDTFQVRALEANVAAILVDTNELQTDWVNGGRLDLILDIIAADTTTDIPALIAALDVLIDAIKAKTDSLTFTVAAKVDANIKAINDTTVIGDGSATPWGP